ncbi:histidinol dehydrogenase [Kroppenstedtia pulmonis]
MPVVKPDELQTRRLGEEATVEQKRIVRDILDTLRVEGDTALRRYTAQFDGVELQDFNVTEEEIQQAYAAVSDPFLKALGEAAERIRRFHQKQRRHSWMDMEEDGTVVGQLLRPLERVGVYVPGGRAAYPSSVLMNVIPAKEAGVTEIIMVTPPGKDGTIDASTLVAAREAGVNRILKLGGAQAVGALAYGTESVPSVDKIVGPGNRYVALAKGLVYGQVDIDMIAGPSEIVIVADETAKPEYVAADLLSQAEHDPMASAVLVTPSEVLAKAVQQQLTVQCDRLERRHIAHQSLQDYGALCVVQDLEEALDIVNRLAPEHLELMVENPWGWIGKVKNAGAVFLGPYSPEPVGDYLAGPNHILPTNGTARFFSPLGVDDFMKKTSLISYSKQALFRDGVHVMTLAEAEGLTGHAASVRLRLEEGEQDE